MNQYSGPLPAGRLQCQQRAQMAFDLLSDIPRSGFFCLQQREKGQVCKDHPPLFVTATAISRRGNSLLGELYTGREGD